MPVTNKQWWLALLVSFLQGGYGALASGAGALVIDPEHFNLSEGLGHVALLLLASFFAAGAMHAAAYLVRKPVPPSLAAELAPEDQAIIGAAAVNPVVSPDTTSTSPVLPPAPTPPTAGPTT